ncbi:MAG: MauE/DoxX family redox-associated membrane protein [Syntrophobacteraceae bacterium]
MRSFLGRYLFLVTRLAIGTLLIAASIDKIAHPAEFAKIVHNYQILPDGLINITAITLPWIEALLGVLIVAGKWLPGAAVLANLLLVGFWAALLYNFARGLNVHCGCFTTSVTGTPQMGWYIVRDSFFLALALALTAQVFRSKSAGTASR